MNTDHIAAVAEVVSEALLSERERTDGRLAEASEQIENAKQALLADFAAVKGEHATKDAELLATISESHKQLSIAADAAISLVKSQVLSVEKAVKVAVEAFACEAEAGECRIADLQAKLKLFEDAASEDLKQLHILKGQFDDFAAQDALEKSAAAERLAAIAESNYGLPNVIEARFSESKEFAEKIIGERIELIQAEFAEKTASAYGSISLELVQVSDRLSAISEISDGLPGVVAAGFSESKHFAEKAIGDSIKLLQDDLAEKVVNLSDSIAFAVAKAKEAEQKSSATADAMLERIAELQNDAAKAYGELVVRIDKQAADLAASLKSLDETAKLAEEITNAEFSGAHSAVCDEVEKLKSEVIVQSARLDHIQLQKGDVGRDGLGLDVPIWQPGIYRKDAVVQHDMGRCSIALNDTAEQPGRDSANWKRIGNFGMKLCGIKSEGAIYEEGDIFIDDGTSFIFSGGKAKMFAQRGRKGDKGDMPTPVKGDKGASVIDAAVVGDALDFVNSDGDTFSVPLKAFEPIIRRYAREVAMELLTQAGIAE